MKKRPPTIPLMSKQSGNAAILFALMIPVLFGIFILASDGARALQSKARLNDALEAASLAIAAADKSELDSKDMAQNYIVQYMPDITSASVTSDAVISVDINPSEGDATNLRQMKYRVSATTTHKSWFPGNNTVEGFGDTFNTSGLSIAQKYQSEAVDVVFAADFSGSMGYEWTGSSSEARTFLGMPYIYKYLKYEDLLGIISEVTDELDIYNKHVGSNRPKNTAAFTAFNIYTNNMEKASEEGLIWCYIDDKVYTGEHTFPDFVTSIFHPITAIIQFKNAVLDFFTDQVDFGGTIEQIFTPKNCIETISTFYFAKPNFNDVAPTSDFVNLNKKIETFSPTIFGDTASYQGIIRGAQLADEGTNKRRLIILLTDGRDTSNGISDKLEFLVGQTGNHKYYLEELVKSSKTDENTPDTIDNMGMCDFIRATFKEEEVDTKIAIIGFDYDPGSNTGLKNCADVVFDAKNKDEIKNTIMALISEETGYLSL